MPAVRSTWRDHRIRVIAVLIAAVVVVAALIWWLVDRVPEMTKVQGEVVIGQEKHWNEYNDAGNCAGTAPAFVEGATIRIQPEDGELARLTAEAGEVQDDGSCAFAFSGEIERAESYIVYLDRYILGWYEDGGIRQSSGDKSYLDFDITADGPDLWNEPV